MSDQWHLLHNGQQYGPYNGEDLMQFVQEGRVVRDTLLWTEGMESWAMAASIDGLFPPDPVQQAGSQPVAAGAAANRGIPKTVAATRASAQRDQPSRQSARVPAGPYPAVAIKPASFELLVTLFGSWVLLLALAAWARWTMHKSDTPVPGVPIDLAALGNQALMLQVMLLAAGACLISWTVLNFIYLGRLWTALQHGRPRTTPDKAVGLLFVPGFNLYWIFVAFYGLAQDWNRITKRFADLNRAPRMSEGLFLAFCCLAPPVVILWLPMLLQEYGKIHIGALSPQVSHGLFVGFCFFPPIGFILWLPVMLQVCRAVTFMALPPQHRVRISRPR